jgi:CheY-like chemotaxis protein
LHAKKSQEILRVVFFLCGNGILKETVFKGDDVERVLMVDDDRELYEVLQQYLAIEGFELSGVHDGESGIVAALSGEYALVLLDVMLPGANGFEVLRCSRSHRGSRSGRR